MADVDVSAISGSSALPKLAPDLTYPSDKVSDAGTYKTVTGIDGSSGLAVALSGSNKYAVSVLEFSNMINEDYDIILTVNGEQIWNDTVAVTSGQLNLLGPTGGASIGSNPNQEGSYEMSNFSLQIQSTTDTDVTLSYLVREIK